MGRRLKWIVAALVAVGLIVAVGAVLLTGSDDGGDTASSEETVAGAPVASLPAPASPAAQAAAIAALEQFWTPERLEEALNNPLPAPPRADVPDQPAGSEPVPSAPSGAIAEADPTEATGAKSATVTQGACKQPRALPAEPGFSTSASATGGR